MSGPAADPSAGPAFLAGAPGLGGPVDRDAAPPPAPVPQRALIVLPSTGEFNSRTWRIATTLAGRGHDVTVLARSGPGLARDERVAAGYRIVRVRISAVDGLPLPRWARDTIARARGRRRTRGAPTTTAPTSTTEAAPAAPVAPVAPARRAGIVDRVARGVGSVRRITAIALTVRSQARASVSAAPDADMVHGMAYMGIRSPSPSAVGGAPRSSTTRGTSTSMRATSPACHARRERSWARASAGGPARPTGSSP